MAKKISNFTRATQAIGGLYTDEHGRLIFYPDGMGLPGLVIPPEREKEARRKLALQAYSGSWLAELLLLRHSFRKERNKLKWIDSLRTTAEPGPAFPPVIARKLVRSAWLHFFLRLGAATFTMFLGFTGLDLTGIIREPFQVAIRIAAIIGAYFLVANLPIPRSLFKQNAINAP